MPRRKLNDLSIPGHCWQRSNGRWSGRYYDADGTRHQVTLDSQSEVIEWLREIDKRRRLGRYIPPSELTVSDLIERWLEQGEVYQSHKPVTLRRHRRTYELHIQPSLGPLRVQQVDRARMRHWVMGMAAQYSASHIANCLAVLNGAFSEAVELGIVEVNPCTRLKRPPEQRKPTATWTLAECAKLWPVLQNDHMWFALYRLLLATGMRQGELRALVWGDIDFGKQRVTIRRTMTLDADGRVIVGNTTKTGKGRSVALAPGTLGALRQWRAATPVRPLHPERDYVFGLRPGYPLGLSYWQGKHDEFIAAAGIRRITLHAVRHTFATLALEQGIPIKVVSDILGHSRVETTINRYQHPGEAFQRTALDAFDELLTLPLREAPSG
jgi:integrase